MGCLATKMIICNRKYSTDLRDIRSSLYFCIALVFFFFILTGRVSSSLLLFFTSYTVTAGYVKAVNEIQLIIIS